MTKKSTTTSPRPSSPKAPTSSPFHTLSLAIPSVPEGYRPIDGPAKQALLKVQGDQRAEVDQALDQLWAQRAELAKDLGTLAPDADKGRALHEHMNAAREANRKAQALAAYTDDEESQANHSVMAYLNEVAGDIEHMATKNPQISARYDKVTTVIKQRRAAIADGIARAKAAKILKANDPKI